MEHNETAKHVSRLEEEKYIDIKVNMRHDNK